MHSSWINGCEWFLNIMKGPCADGLLKIDCHLCHYALSKDELRRHAEPVILGGGVSGGGEVKWRAPGVLPRPGTRVLRQRQTAPASEGPCRTSTINQALKQDTSSYHGITPCRQKRPGLFLRPGALHASSENTSPGKLHGPWPLSRFSRALIHCTSKASE